MNPRLLRRFQPLPSTFDDDPMHRTPAKIDLGRMLYFDTRLSHVEEQVKGPLLNPLEMGMLDGPHAMAGLEAVPAYVAAFEVPSLRNVEQTPYLHDGSAATLEEAVHEMARYQLGLEMSDQEVAAIAAWLDSLTGDIPADYVRRPVLPAAGS